MASKSKRPYSTVKGYFFQDDDASDMDDFDYIKFNFGLKSNWKTFCSQLASLNEKGKADGVAYKLFYVGRHGQGFHNVAEDFYGTLEWDAKWSKLDGNGTSQWVDAHLTETGVEQAQDAHTFWAKQMAEHGMPAPQSYYSSPLDRCIATCNITFAGLDVPKNLPFVPTIKELLREANGVHTCDKRSTKTEIRDAWPKFKFEDGFAEKDKLWTANHRETDPELDARIEKALADIFQHDQNSVISLTTHSGAIASLLRVIGHRVFKLSTGGAIALLVKGRSS